MRFESFHYILKRRAQFIGNFINICKSLACHVRRLNSLHLIENETICSKQIFGPAEAGKSSLSFVDLMRILPVSLCQDLPLDPTLDHSVPKWIKLRGWEYRPGGDSGY